MRQTVDPNVREFLRRPSIAGYWIAGDGWRVPSRTRPRWLTRLFYLWLLEWHWSDATECDGKDQLTRGSV